MTSQREERRRRWRARQNVIEIPHHYTLSREIATWWHSVPGRRGTYYADVFSREAEFFGAQPYFYLRVKFSDPNEAFAFKMRFG